MNAAASRRNRAQVCRARRGTGHERHPAHVVDRHVEVVVAGVGARRPGHPAAAAVPAAVGDPALLHDVEVEQLARTLADVADGDPEGRSVSARRERSWRSRTSRSSSAGCGGAGPADEGRSDARGGRRGSRRRPLGAAPGASGGAERIGPRDPAHPRARTGAATSRPSGGSPRPCPPAMPSTRIRLTGSCLPSSVSFALRCATRASRSMCAGYPLRASGGSRLSTTYS
jgi:hypothetical protein